MMENSADLSDVPNLSDSQPNRAKISLSLTTSAKRSWSKKPASDGKTLSLVQDYNTIAEEAQAISQRRRDQGTLLVIPCPNQHGQDRDQPLLMSRLELLNQGLKGDSDAPCQTHETNEDLEAEAHLIESAQKHQMHLDSNNDSGEKPNRLIINPRMSQNEKLTSSIHGKNEPTTHWNDEDIFRQELSHHAPDVDPNSQIYASVAIRDFGSALLRGMGWKGNSDDDATKKDTKEMESKSKEQILVARPHRLGLGAIPLLPTITSVTDSGTSHGNGIYRRAKRPEEVKQEEERQRAHDEAERMAAEQRQLDVQYTLQKGSVVWVSDGKGIGNGKSRNREKEKLRQRAVVVKTNGVPGLNQILINMEGGIENLTVTKRSVVLCSWEELKRYPFQMLRKSSHEESLLKQKTDGRNHGSHGKERKRKDIDRNDWGDGNLNDPCNHKQTQQDYSIEQECNNKANQHDNDYDNTSYERKYNNESNQRYHEKHEKLKNHKRDDHSDVIHYNERSKREWVNNEHSKKHKSEKRDSFRNLKHDSHGRREHREYCEEKTKCHERSSTAVRSKSDANRSKGCYQSSSFDIQCQQHHHWLLPNIRVRLITKKIPKYYLKKGIVQDVIPSLEKISDKAILLMDNNGQVLDNIPERYLETALPPIGGNVIVLEGDYRWKKGRLLERYSTEGKGVIQIFEDLEVLAISLDSIAEWCGPIDEDLI